MKQKNRTAKPTIRELCHYISFNISRVPDRGSSVIHVDGQTFRLKFRTVVKSNVLLLILLKFFEELETVLGTTPSKRCSSTISILIDHNIDDD